MNKKDEAKLAARAKEAKELRTTADAANSMLISWGRRKKNIGADKVRISLGDDGPGRWWAYCSLTGAEVQREVIPILRRIRDQARAELAALEMP